MKTFYNLLFSCLFLVCNSHTQAQNNLLWGTYFGHIEQSGGNVRGEGIDTDAMGNAYIAGTASSMNGIATPTAHQFLYGGGVRDAFLAKFSANGNLLWATYYGDTGQEIGKSVKVDNVGNVYLLILSANGNSSLTTSGVHQTIPGGGNDALLVKFNPNGTLLWSTYFGGPNGDSPQDLAIDEFNNVYIVGITNSNTGIASNGFQNSIAPGPGSQDLFLAKFDPNGSLLWATYYGGEVDENGAPDVAVDCENNVYISGTTSSTSGISSNGFQNSLNGSKDAFLVKFDANGNRLWATYYGGIGSPGIIGNSDFDEGRGITTDINGNIYLSGNTTSTSNIADNGHDVNYSPPSPILNTGVTYLVKFDTDGNRLWGTYYGDDGSLSASTTTDICGNVYLLGSTKEQSPPSNISTGNGHQATNAGLDDVFLVMFDSLGNRLWGTYYGGDQVDSPQEICLDNNGDVYFVGKTRSTTNIATAGAHQTAIVGTWDVFTVKMSTGGSPKYTGSNCPASLVTTTTTQNNSCFGQCSGSATTTVSGGISPYSYEWFDDAGNTIGTNAPTLGNLCAGEYSVTIRTCSGSISDTIQVTEPPLNINTQSPSICEGDQVVVNGNSYTTSGTYSDTIIGGAANGCDSIVNTNLTVLPNATSTDQQIACDSFTWIDGVTYNASTNTPTHTIVGGAANGCDSIVTLDLTINNSTVGTDVQSSCGSFTWIDGVTYNSSTNTPTHTIVGGASNGCDSIVTLDLTINNSTSTDVQTSCGSFTWIDGVTYSSSTNTPTFTIVGGAANGCDSIVTLDLTVNNPSTGTDVQTSCGSYIWIDGVTYTSSTSTPTYTIVGGAANGCDSIVTLDLTINTSSTTINTYNECEGFSINVGANTYNTTGVYTDVVNGCDTIITDLTINPAPSLTLIKSDDNCGEEEGSVSAIANSVNPPLTYSWNTGSTDSTINNLPSGIYTVTVNDGSGCSAIDSIDVQNFIVDCDYFVYLPNAFTPNGDNNNDILFVRGEGITSFTLSIYNRWGNRIFESDTLSKGWDGTYKGEPQNTAVFVYTIEGVFENGETFEESGDISLLR